VAENTPFSDYVGFNKGGSGREDAPTKANAAYHLTPEEEAAVKLVEDLYKKAAAYRSRYDARWMDFYKFFRGKQWPQNRPSYRNSEVINMVFQLIQQQVAVMTDARPQFGFIATEPEDREFAEILNDLSDYDWDKHNWLAILVELLYDGKFYGTFWSYMGWDPEEDYGMGAPCWESRDPFLMYPDPDARQVGDKHCSYLVECEYVTTSKLKAKYPDLKEFLAPDIADVFNIERTNVSQGSIPYTLNDKFYFDGINKGLSQTTEKTLVKTLYYRDPETCEEDDPNNPETKITKLKYPHGRKIITACNLVLADEPLEEHFTYPFQKGVNYTLPREFYGISEVEQVESPQKIFNKLVSFALDVLVFAGNPIWVIDNDSEVDTDNLFNTPGMVVEKAKGTEVRREEGVQLQPYVLQLIDRMEGWFNNLGGSTDVTRGEAPGGVTASSAIEQLLDTGFTRIRLNLRLVDMFLQDVGRAWVNNTLKHRTAPKVYRITNKQGLEQYFRMSMSTNEAGNKVATVTPIDAQGGQTVEGRTTEYVIKGQFDVKVQTLSGLPFSKEQAEQKAFALFDRGLIDAEEVLKTIDYPNRESVLERLQQAQAAAAQAQPQQQGA
jgi:hypothetical protein